MKRDQKVTHHVMSSIRGKDTKIEVLLRKALFRDGYRYRKNDRTLPGTPDIVFRRQKICIFCDGDFFHGYDQRKIEESLSTNADFWKRKIQRNRRRDQEVDEKLSELGYLVLRYWEHEIEKNLSSVIQEIELALESRSRKKPL